LRVLIFEYVTGGGLANEAPAATLLKEGDLMLKALIGDLEKIKDLHLVVFRDYRLTRPAFNIPINWITIFPEDNVLSLFTRMLGEVDAAWPIAPETGSILEKLCLLVESSGKNLLSCPSSAVKIATNKKNTATILASGGVEVVPTYGLNLRERALPLRMPIVIKPADGAGCEGTHYIDQSSHWPGFSAEESLREWVVQPYLPGISKSISALFSAGEASFMSCNRQHISIENGTFKLHGCTVNQEADFKGHFSHLINRIAMLLPDLWGYVGVDIIQDGPKIWVMEINPRLTTSYTGLRTALNFNIAESIINLKFGGSLPTPPKFSAQSVHIDLRAN